MVDVELSLKVVGSAVGVIGVVIAYLQLRRDGGKKPHDPLPSGSAVLDPRVILRPPVGRLPKVFRDRKAVRRKLRKAVRRPDGKVHLLHGLGGSGKTAIAIKTAQEVAGRRRMVWWVSGVTSPEFITSMVDIARALGARENEVEDVLAGRGNPADLVWRYLERHKKWLLIIDNVDDIRVLDVGTIKAGDGNGWLRPTHRGTLLVTSRLGDLSQWGAFTSADKVGPLDPRDAALMLRDLAPSSGSYQEAEALADGLGFLPLALRHVGSLLSSPFSSEPSFAAYSFSLRTNLSTLMKQGESERDVLSRTWESSLDMLNAQGRGQARPILRTLSCFAPSMPIPTRMLDKGILADLCDGDVEAVTEGMKALESVKLIDIAEGQPVDGVAIVVHPLIAEANRLHLDEGRETALVTKVSVALVLHAVEGLKMEEPRDWPRWFEMRPHMMSALEQVSRHPVDGYLGEMAKCVARAIAALVYAGYYTTALDVTRTALSLVRGLGESDPGLLDLRHELAGALLYTGNAADAEREYRAVAEARSKAFGAEDPQTLISLFQLAYVLAMTDRLDEAEKVARRVLEVRIRVLEPGDYYILVTRYVLDDIFFRQGRYEECRQRCTALLGDVRTLLGAEHFLTITTQHLLARVLLEQGEPREAEAELRAVLDAGRGTLGDRHPEMLKTRLTLARALATMRRKRDARAELNRVLTELGGSVPEGHSVFEDFQLAEDALQR